MKRRDLLLGGTSLAALGALVVALRPGIGPSLAATPAAAPAGAETFPVSFTDAQWQQRLSPEAYQVLRHAATEPPGSSPLLAEHRPGIFGCAGCALPLFDAATKFESGTGWPSFYQPLPNAVLESTDATLGMQRTEIRCRQCGGHLGHVFNDGPPPTGLRYCMNGLSLKFTPAASAA